MEQHKDLGHQAAPSGPVPSALTVDARSEWELSFAARVCAAYPRMDIYSPPGSAVVFDALGGYDGEVRRAALKQVEAA